MAPCPDRVATAAAPPSSRSASASPGSSPTRTSRSRATRCRTTSTAASRCCGRRSSSSSRCSTGRSSSSCRGRSRSDRRTAHVLRVAATIQAGLGVAFVVAALIARDPIEDELFGGSSTLYWIFVATVVAYAASYFARGFLAGHHRFGAYGLLVLLEATSRCLVRGRRGRRDQPRGRTRSRSACSPRRSSASRSSRSLAQVACHRSPEPKRTRGAGGRVHACAWHRVRGGGAARDAQRADVHQRRAADRERDRGRRRGRRARRLHVQRPPDRPRAAPALPVDPGADPPPPDARCARRARPTQFQRKRPRHPHRDRRVRGGRRAGAARHRPLGDGPPVRQRRRLRPRRPRPDRGRHGPLPDRRDPQPGRARARTRRSRRPRAGSPPRPRSSASS